MAGAGVNRGELIARPALRRDNPRAREAPSGIELAGTIESVGEGVTGWAVGDRVMARGRACHAEAAVVPAEALMTSPAGLSDVEAATIPNVFVTAHDALVTAAGVGAGDSVLITAGSSGVGTAAIQLAARLGAEPVLATTRSPAKAPGLLELGATAVIDTTDEGWVATTRAAHGPMGAVIDQVGGSLFPHLLAALGVTGRYVSVGRNDGSASTIDLDLVARNRLTLIGVTFRTRSEAEALACSHRFANQFLAAFDDGGLRPVLDRTFALADLPAAHQYMLGDSQVGKVVLVP
jgi:NADPH2:quinone reductase